MKSFIKDFLINLLGCLIVSIAILIWLGIIIGILFYIPAGILQIILTFLYSIISAALLITILCKADKEIINKIRGYK